ncbi:MAG: hypothetical protein ABW134_15410 [Candidatus Thiodiazotropha endolucinida]
MDKQKMTLKEYQRSCICTVSVMHQLAISIGAKNPHHFARIFDEMTGEDTQSSGLWRNNFNGERPLSNKQLKRLFCIDNKVKKLYIEGPCKLWMAMWGNPSELISIIRGYSKCFSQMPLYAITKEVSRSIRESGEGNKTLEDLVWSICHYRFTKEIQPLALVDVDRYPVTQASCAWNLVEICLHDKFIMKELNALGVRGGIAEELVRIESERTCKLSMEQRLTDLNIPGFSVEFSWEEAEHLEAFVEDALSDDDAIDSAYGIADMDEDLKEVIAFSC